MGGRVDARRQPRHDRHARLGQLLGQVERDVTAVSSTRARADHANARTGDDVDRPLVEQHGRCREIARECRGIRSGVERGDTDAGLAIAAPDRGGGISPEQMLPSRDDNADALADLGVLVVEKVVDAVALQRCSHVCDHVSVALDETSPQRGGVESAQQRRQRRGVHIGQ